MCVCVCVCVHRRDFVTDNIYRFDCSLFWGRKQFGGSRPGNQPGEGTLCIVWREGVWRGHGAAATESLIRLCIYMTFLGALMGF